MMCYKLYITAVKPGNVSSPVIPSPRSDEWASGPGNG